MIPAEAIEAAAQLIYRTSGRKRVMSYEQARPACADEAKEILEAAAPHMLASGAVSAVLALHRELPCLDEDGEPIGGSYCEECKDHDDHSGERVHEVYPCMTVREITKALAGEETFTAMRDRIESGVRK